MDTPLSIEQRFWQYTDRRGPDECWPWTGTVNSKGYGQLRVARHRRRTATRFSWELRNGKPFPADKLACHKCDNPRCVNPDHIWPGTARENHNDACAKGRRPVARLTDADVREIRQAYVPRSATNGTTALARRLGLHPTTILRAVNGRPGTAEAQYSALIKAWNRAGQEARGRFLGEIR
jgi:hypothetical protein